MTLDGSQEVVRHPLPGGEALVWRDEGSPYDNLLHVYLLGADGSIVDGLEAGAAMADGMLALLATGTDVFDFNFFDNGRTYRLTISASARVAWPWSLPMGFRYKSSLGRHRLSVRPLHRQEAP